MRLSNSNECPDAGTERKNLCVMPWINLHVTTDGTIAPCCEFDGDIGKLSDTTLIEAWQGDELREIRRKFADAETVSGCWKCFDREASEGHSMRLDKNRKFSHWHETLLHDADLMNAGPAHAVTMDLRFSNLCNFKCRSCWHGASSKWFTDGKAIGVTAGRKAEIRSFDSLDEVVRQIGPGMDDLEEIYFAGGEPLIMEEHYALLRLLHDRGQTHIKLAYNTNLSVTRFAGQSIFDLWAKFDNVNVSASIDAAGAKGSYVRSGFEWPTYVKNVHELRTKCPHAELSFGITVSSLNILILPELLRALTEECGATPSAFLLHSLQEPPHYRTQVLPARFKKRATRQIDDYIAELIGESEPGEELDGFIAAVRGITDYMNANDLSDKLPELKSITDQLDSLRSENIGDVLPELAPALESVSVWRKPWLALRQRLGYAMR
ncbi:MAG: twitch domain-containing radical SAM protein [Anderseniella sp.]